MPGDGRVARTSSPDPAVTGSLKKSSQFRRVFSGGRRYRGTAFRAVFIRNTLGVIRLGFSLSAKSGNAVERNRLRRRIKSLSRETEYSTGADVVILPQGKLRGKTWTEIREDFRKLLEEIERTFGENR